MEIRNENQFNAAQKKINHLEKALSATDEAFQESKTSEIHPTFLRESLKQQIAMLREQVREFAELRHASKLPFTSLSELGAGLVKARIARQFTQKDLASRMGCTQQSIQQYESRLYEQANLQTLIAAAGALEIDCDGRFVLSTASVQPTVIVVDDDPETCKAIVRYLSSLAKEWRILAAGSLAELTKLLDEVSPVLVITDLVMDNSIRAGIDVAEHVRDVCPAATVVVLTGNIGVLDKSVAAKAGVTRVVDKCDLSEKSPCRRLFEIAKEVASLP